MYGEQVSNHVALLLCRAFTIQHIITIALEPLGYFFHISESFFIGRRSKRLDDLVGLGMFALCGGIVGMASGATQIVIVFGLEKILPRVAENS